MSKMDKLPPLPAEIANAALGFILSGNDHDEALRWAAWSYCPTVEIVEREGGSERFARLTWVEASMKEFGAREQTAVDRLRNKS